MLFASVLTQMVFAALARQVHLLLALFKTSAVLVASFIYAMRATDAFHIGRVFQFRWRQWHAASIAFGEVTRLQPMAHAHPTVEDETLAFPFAFFFRHVFKIFQNTSFEMEDILEAFLPQ